MRYSIVALCLLASAGLAAARADENTGASDPASEKATSDAHAIEAGLGWLANRNCVHCHSITVPHGHDYSQLMQYLNAHVSLAESVHDTAHCPGDTIPTENAAYLGLAVSPLPTALRKHLTLPDGTGLLIDAVEPDSPAQQAGVVQYDVLARIDEQLLVNSDQYRVLVRTFDSGAEVRLSLVHENQPKTVTARLVERAVPAADASSGLGVAAADWDQDGHLDVMLADAAMNEPPASDGAAAVTAVTWLGVTTSTPPAAVVEQLALTPGVGLMVDAVEPDSPAGTAGIQTYDVLIQLDDQLLINADQLAVLVRGRRSGDEVMFTVIRGGRRTTVSATLGQRTAESGGAAAAPPVQAGEAVLRLQSVLDERVRDHWRDLARLSGDPGDSYAAGDEEFVRRVYLDILGILPSPGDVRKFLDDARPNKREALIDELLGQPEAVSRWSDTVSALFSDSEHSLTLTSQDGRQRRLLAKDKDGKVLFDGPVDTPLERQSLPAPIAARLAMMFEGLERQSTAPRDELTRPLEELLRQPLSIEFTNTPLEEVMDTLRHRAGGNLVVNWKALKAAGCDGQTPITLKLRSASLSAVLTSVLALAGGDTELTYEVKNEVILVSTVKKRARASSKP